MGKRSTGRKLAMQLVYQSDVQNSIPTEVASLFFAESDAPMETRDWALRLASDAWDNCSESDELIKSYSIDWHFDRIHVIDRAILRLAFYELLHTGTDSGVVINEAIELAKKYSTQDSPRFINGLLGQYIKDKCLPEL